MDSAGSRASPRRRRQLLISKTQAQTSPAERSTPQQRCRRARVRRRPSRAVPAAPRTPTAAAPGRTAPGPPSVDHQDRCPPGPPTGRPRTPAATGPPSAATPRQRPPRPDQTFPPRTPARSGPARPREDPHPRPAAPTPHVRLGTARSAPETDHNDQSQQQSTTKQQNFRRSTLASEATFPFCCDPFERSSFLFPHCFQDRY